MSDSSKSVVVAGGGVAGLSAACALAEAGYRVRLLERRRQLGGRASSYAHPGVQETIDNCQHALFGCCTNLLRFYERIGAKEKIHWTEQMTMIEPGGRRSLLGASYPSLPAPLHSLPNLLRAQAFSWSDKLALGRAFAALLRPVPADSQESLAAWLERQGQTRGALNRFWRLVIASALNAELDQIALPYAAKVIRELFMNSRQAGAMGVSTVPLSELYAGAVAQLEARGATVEVGVALEGAVWDEARRGWRLTTSAGELDADSLLLALPFEGLAKLLPMLPAGADSDALGEKLGRLRHGPICSVHLWFDREITELEHAVLLDREMHWMYNKSRLQPGRGGEGSYLELVTSASHSFAALPLRQAMELAVRELTEFFPAVAQARLVKSALVKEMRATFGVPPGVDAYRPQTASPWANCFLAGDWTATGWPSTMESAARSGHLAAEALCRQDGRARSFLAPELRPQGLMRILG